MVGHSPNAIESRPHGRMAKHSPHVGLSIPPLPNPHLQLRQIPHQISRGAPGLCAKELLGDETVERLYRILVRWLETTDHEERGQTAQVGVSSHAFS